MMVAQFKAVYLSFPWDNKSCVVVLECRSMFKDGIFDLQSFTICILLGISLNFYS